MIELVILLCAMVLMAINMVVVTVYQRCGGVSEKKNIAIIQMTTLVCWIVLLGLIFFTMSAPWLDKRPTNPQTQAAAVPEYFTVSIYDKGGELIQQYPGCDSIRLDNGAVSFVYDNETESLTINNKEYVVMVDGERAPTTSEE